MSVRNHGDLPTSGSERSRLLVTESGAAAMWDRIYGEGTWEKADDAERTEARVALEVALDAMHKETVEASRKDLREELDRVLEIVGMPMVRIFPPRSVNIVVSLGDRDAAAARRAIAYWLYTTMPDVTKTDLGRLLGGDLSKSHNRLRVVRWVKSAPRDPLVLALLERFAAKGGER